MRSSAVDAVATARCIALTTYKRDRTPVTTPIWFNVIGGNIYLTTDATSWKVKRIRNNGKVAFAACTQRGRVTGPAFEGTARILPPSELAEVMKAKKRRYFLTRIIQMIPSKRDQIAIEIVS